MDWNNESASVLKGSRVDFGFGVHFVTPAFELLVEFSDFQGVVSDDPLGIDFPGIDQGDFDGHCARAFDPHAQG